MTNSNLLFKVVIKDRLFYDQFEYCFGFGLAEATVLRGLKHDLIDTRLDQRIEWREMARKRWKNSTDDMGWNQINAQVRQDLHTVCATIIGSGVDCKIAVSHHVGYLYTNDLGLIDQLRLLKYPSGLPILSGMKYSRAVVNRSKDTILLRKSLFKKRSYFAYVKLTAQEKENISNFFNNHPGHIRVSPALTSFLNEKTFLRTLDHYFIDYNDEQWLTMLALIRPGLIRKTQQIVTK